MELELRLILLAIGLVIIGLIYAWGMRKNIKEGLERRRRLKKQRSSEALPTIDTPESQAEQSATGNILDEFEVRVIDRTAQYSAASTATTSTGQSEPERAAQAVTPFAELENRAQSAKQDAPIDEDIDEAPVLAQSSEAESDPAKSDSAEFGPAQSEAEQPRQQEAKSEQASMTVLLTVLAPSGQNFSGPAIRQAAKELALPLGEQGVLECNTDTETGKHPKTVFSVAHLREPGTFDTASFDTLATPGLLLFLSLPGPLLATEAVRMMFGVAGQLAEKLGGTVCDEKRRRFTRDGYVELHHRASQFEQQTMSEG